MLSSSGASIFIFLSLAVTFCATGERFEYVGPGADPKTEGLREIVRLLNARTPYVPKDPHKGGELSMLSQIFAKYMQTLAKVAATPK